MVAERKRRAAPARTAGFPFAELFGGSYQVNVTAEHYVGLEFGQRAPGKQGRRIELAEGMQFDKADFALPRTSAVEGRLVDEFGDPVPGVTIQVARVVVAAGKRRLMPVSSGTIATRPSDDLGQFRVFNLPPGDYYALALSGPFAGADDPSGFAPHVLPRHARRDSGSADSSRLGSRCP